MSKRVDRRRRGSKPVPTSVPVRSQAPAVNDDGVSQRLARLVDTPYLAQIVPRLAPEVLHQLIRERGLEACGAFIALSTPEQLAAVLDLDLWQAAPGRNDQFDPSRFGTWLEAL